METKHCESCSMPMVKPEDFGGGKTDSPYCCHCCDDQGNLKSFDEVLEGMTNLAVKMMGSSEEKARHTAMENMKQQPAWQDHSFPA